MPKATDKKRELLTEAAKCVKCGACRSVCPSLYVLKREPSGPRGRVVLIETNLKGDAEFGKAYLRDIKDCTLCGSCYSNCPKGVNTPELILGARAIEVEQSGLGLLSSLAMKGMSGGFLKDFAMKAASKLQGLFLKATENENGLVGRFSLPLIGGGRLMPKLSGEFFLDGKSAKARTTVSDCGGKKKVAFFAGCGVNYLLPSIGEATVKVLEESGAEVVVPKGQVCCGMPALSAGDLKTAKALQVKNLEVFEKGDYDYIVTSCATCSHALKNVFETTLAPYYDEDPKLKERVERFSAKVRDVTEILKGDVPYERKAGPLRGTVTYHDPCHLRRYQGISEEPRALLADTGLEFVRMPNPCKCCGLGGGVGFSNYELSMKIAKRKADGVRASGAEIISTACPGCIIQLKDALNRYGVEGRVVHVVELL